MVVSIEFLGIQRILTKKDSISMPITEGTRANDALEYIKHRYPELSLNSEIIIITVNHEMASLDRILNVNDTVSFLPHISGG